MGLRVVAFPATLTLLLLGTITFLCATVALVWMLGVGIGGRADVPGDPQPITRGNGADTQELCRSVDDNGTVSTGRASRLTCGQERWQFHIIDAQHVSHYIDAQHVLHLTVLDGAGNLIFQSTDVCEAHGSALHTPSPSIDDAGGPP